MSSDLRVHWWAQVAASDYLSVEESRQKRGVAPKRKCIRTSSCATNLEERRKSCLIRVVLYELNNKECPQAAAGLGRK